MHRLTIVLISLSLMSTGTLLPSVFAAPDTAPAENPIRLTGRSRSEAGFVDARLTQGDDAAVREEIARLKQLADAGAEIKVGWIKTLAKRKFVAEADSLATQSIINMAESNRSVSELQKVRVELLLDASRAADALVAAKGYYNLADLSSTEGAITLVAVAMSAANPDNRQLANDFKKQQVEWSAAEVTPDAAAKNILKEIKTPGEVFANGVARWEGRDFDPQIATGNLLLLADKPAEARKAFETAELVAKDSKQTATAISGIARAIRSEAGALGPANAYILSQRGDADQTDPAKKSNTNSTKAQ